jgi:hypothetical protein
LQRYSTDPARDSLGRTAADLLHEIMRANHPSPTVSVDAKLELPDWNAGAKPVVSWTESAGYSTSARSGPVLMIWDDGVYVRVMPGALSAVVGRLPRDRVDQIVDELSETGLLDRPSFSSVSVDSSSETFRIRLGSQSLEFESDDSSPWIFGPHDLDDDLQYLELNRARAVLQIVRTEHEDSVDRHLVNGRFRGVDLGLRSPR